VLAVNEARSCGLGHHDTLVRSFSCISCCVFVPCYVWKPDVVRRTPVAAYDNETGRARGFAHVNFVDTVCAAKALKLSGGDLSGREVYIDSARERGEGGGGGDSRTPASGKATNLMPIRFLKRTFWMPPSFKDFGLVALQLFMLLYAALGFDVCGLAFPGSDSAQLNEAVSPSLAVLETAGREAKCAVHI
jgi:RNA recognition motif-containing protein